MSTVVWKWKFGAIDWPGAEWKSFQSQVGRGAPWGGGPPFVARDGLLVMLTLTTNVGPAHSESGPGAVVYSFSWYLRSALVSGPRGAWFGEPGGGGHGSAEASEPWGTYWAPEKLLVSFSVVVAYSGRSL